MCIMLLKSNANNLHEKEKVFMSFQFYTIRIYRRRVVSSSKTLYSPKVLVNYPGSDGSVPA